MTTPDIDKLTFEEALEALSVAVQQLESGALQLEQSLALFEHGQALADHCQRLLDKASLRVEQLTADGEIIERRVPDAGE